MMIRVMYSDGRFDMVKPGMLDNLLDRQAVTSFKRNDGWAVVGRDAIRSSGRGNYRGRERRLL
jgi:predicted chitinase